MTTKAPDISELKEIFDNYNTLMAGGKIEEGLDLRSKEVKKSTIEYMKDEEGKVMTESMIKSMLPVSYQIDHTENKKSGNVEVNCTGTFISQDPDDHGKQMKLEFQLVFLKEKGGWKIGDFNLLGDPDHIERSKNQGFEDEGNYDIQDSTVVGGRVISVKFEKDYTLVAIRVTNQEVLVTLPKKEELETEDFKTEELVPWSLVEVDGYPHQKDKLKVWGLTIKFIEELDPLA